MNLVATENKSEPFVCIKDLVENGLSSERFEDEESSKPFRHEITLFIAAWCKMVGFEPEIYRDWLINYCGDVLLEMSSSSISKIRHSTKSSIKYIHRSDVAFECNCENNIFKAHCSLNCPVYGEMKEIYLKRIEQEQKRLEQIQRESEQSEVEPAPLKVKEIYEKQFMEAVAKIEEYLKKGYTKKEIATLLNENGYKTIMGQEWKATSVSRISIEKGWAPKRNRRKKAKNISVQLKLF